MSSEIVTSTPWRSRIYAAVRHPERAAFLVLERKGHFRLPFFQAEDVWLSAMRKITPVFEKQLAAPLWGLRQVFYRSNRQTRVLEGVIEFELLDSGWQPPTGFRWAGLETFDAQPLLPKKIEKAVRACLQERNSGTPSPLRPPWARPGWMDYLRPWLVRQVEALGHRLVDVRPIKQWGISCVLQIRTSGPVYYFKTTNGNMPLFVNEAQVTGALAGWFPRLIPKPAAVRIEDDWMLLPAFDRPLADEIGSDERVELYRQFAGLQIESIPYTEDLLSSGALDRRIPVLRDQLDGLLEDSLVLRKLDRETRKELKQHSGFFREIINRFEALGIPDTLVHGDLHEDNAAILEERVVIYDWTDACISHPFVDLQSPLWSLTEDESRRALEAYFDPWKAIFSENVLQEGLRLARVVLHLHHAVSYQYIGANLEPLSRPELDITHLILKDALKEAKQLIEQAGAA